MMKTWKVLKETAVNELSNKKLYVVDVFCGTNADSRMAIRFIMEVWQSWSNAPVLKTGNRLTTIRRFESYIFRKIKMARCLNELGPDLQNPGKWV